MVNMTLGMLLYCVLMGISLSFTGTPKKKLSDSDAASPAKIEKKKKQTLDINGWYLQVSSCV